MLRDDILQKLRNEADGRGQTTRLASRIGIGIPVLWRIIHGKSKGDARTWDKIFAYYGK